MTRRPNILFILTDQQRWDTLGCYGRPIFPGLTPHLDQLASQGTLYRHAFSMQPVCGPARSCLQTGLYATQTGCHVNGRPLPSSIPTLAGHMSQAGYATACIGKWHLAPKQPAGKPEQAIPMEHRGGYRDHWMASNVPEFTSTGHEGYWHDQDGRRVDWQGYRADRTTDFALQYLQEHHQRDDGRPFFLFLSYVEPHHQNNQNRFIGPPGSAERFAAFHTPGDLAGAQGDWPRQMPDYLGCCWSIDQNIARLRQCLQRLSLDDQTLILFTSDHGCHFRTRNDEYKRSCHDDAIRVPLLIHGPGFTGGQVRDELVSLIDIPATILHAGQANPLPGMQGRPLQELADPRCARTWPLDVFVQISESHIGRAVRTHRWKYAITSPTGNPQQDAGSEAYIESHLYDLQDDPDERNNRVADPALRHVRHELAGRLMHHMRQAGEPPAVIKPLSVA